MFPLVSVHKYTWICSLIIILIQTPSISKHDILLCHISVLRAFLQLFDWKKLRSIFSIQKRYLKFPVFIYDNHTDFCYGYSSAKCIHVYLEQVHVNIQVLYLFQFKHRCHLLCGIAFLRVLSLFLNKEIVKGLKLGDQLQSLLYIIELFQVFFSFFV